MHKELEDILDGMHILGGLTLSTFSEIQLEGASRILAGLSDVASGLATIKSADGGRAERNHRPAGEDDITVHVDADEAPASPIDDERWKTPAGPAHQPPGEEVQCEEAELQRRTPSRIAELLDDGVVYLERVLYYLHLAGAAAQAARGDVGACVVDENATAETIEEAEVDHKTELHDAQQAAIATHMLSIECLPGTRPVVDEMNRAAGAVAWQETYDLLQELKAADAVDSDDEAQILFKLGDKPGDERTF